MTTGDTAQAREFLDEDCHACDTVPKRIERVYAQGHELRTKGWKVEEILLDPPARPDRTVFFLRVRTSTSEVVNNAGKVLDSTESSVVGIRMELVHGEGRWVRRT